MLDIAWARLTSVYLQLKDREDGQALVEYALILALVAVAAVVTLGLIGGAVNSTLDTVLGKL